VADVQRAGRIGGHELDACGAAVAGMAAAVAGALRERCAHFALVRGRAQEEVDEAGAGDLDLRDRILGRQRGYQRRREVARLAASGLRQQQGGIGREIAVVAVLGAFDDERSDGVHRQFATGLQGGDRGEDEVAELFFHGVGQRGKAAYCSGPARVRRVGRVLSS
jgi:hypothetical protein